MQDSKNTIAGWVLAGGIVALGLSIVSGKVFHADKPERPEKLGFVIEGVVSSEGEAAAEVPIATLLASADPAKGEKVFAKCSSCHSINSGGANGIGPNLYGVLGKPHASVAGFAYSDALKSKTRPLDLRGNEQVAHLAQGLCRWHQDELRRPGQGGRSRQPDGVHEHP